MEFLCEVKDVIAADDEISAAWRQLLLRCETTKRGLSQADSPLMEAGMDSSEA